MLRSLIAVLAAIVVFGFASPPASAVECEGDGAKISRAYVQDFKILNGKPSFALDLRIIEEKCASGPSTYKLNGLDISTAFKNSNEAKMAFDSVRMIVELGLTTEDAKKLYEFFVSKRRETLGNSQAQKQ